jgi:hypothetical protein
MHLPLDTDRCRGRRPTYVPSTGIERCPLRLGPGGSAGDSAAPWGVGD